MEYLRLPANFTSLTSSANVEICLNLQAGNAATQKTFKYPENARFYEEEEKSQYNLID